MRHLRRPRPRTLAASAVLLAAVITAGLVGRGTAPDPAPTPAPTVAAAPAVDEGTPYTAKVFLQVNCGPFPTARVTLDPTPGGHPDVHLEVGQLPYIHAPQPIFSSVTELNLTAPANRVEATIRVDQASTISVDTADRSVQLPPQQDLSCPQWAGQGPPNHA